MSRSAAAKSEQEKEALKDETNLFRFFLKGLSLKFNLNCDAAKKAAIAEMAVDLLKDMLDDKVLKYAALAFQGLSIRFNMASNDSLDLLMEFLNKEAPDVPDGADLVDEVGLFLDSMNWFDIYSGFPFLQEFIGAIASQGICDLQTGFVTEEGLLAVLFKTDGMDDLFKKVMEGAV